MKKTTVAIFSIIALMAISMFTSCQKHKTELYSCDMNLHNWAAHAREANAGISRDELAKLGIDSQFAVFRSLSNDARLNIYHQKIALALSTETFSDAEKAHLQKLTDFMIPDYYNEEDSTIVDTFFQNWKSEATAKFNWTDEKVFFLVETWLTKDELYKARANAVPNVGDPTLQKPDCNCFYNMACGFWGSCVRNTCQRTRGGCGVFGTTDCKGKCQ